MKIIKNMFYSTAYQMIAVAIPLITMPYISRVLGTSGIGINSFTLSLVSYFTLIGALGIQTYGNREIAYYQKDLYQRSKVFFELIILQFTAVFVTIGSFLLFVSFYHNPQVQFYLLLQGVVLFSTLFNISWFFMGIENFRIIVVRNSIINIVVVVLTFLLVQHKEDLWIYILLTSAAPVLANITVWPFLRHEILKIPLKDLNVIHHLKPTLVLFIPQVSVSIYLSLNKSMLGFLDGYESSGYFSQADSIVRVAFTAVSSFGAAFLPRLSNLFSENREDEVKNLTLKSVDLMNAISIFAIAGLMGTSQTFAVFFFGKNFYKVGNLILVEALVIIFFSWATVFGSQYLLAAKRNKDFTISSIAALVVNIIANLALIPLLGVMGAVIATLLSEFTVAFYRIYVVRGVFPLSQILRGFWKYLLGGGGVFIVLYIINFYNSPSIISYVLQVIVACMIYGVTIFFTNAPVLSVVQPVFKNIFKRK
ncbi:flippase [Lactococcus allomyrinae]|uniref:Flippase n=1 Tax=Lactococcus allomyrinae TaxID=2419773 RepID=A0A387BG47_9LACT|nr:flippase [Lactococcus allomyrinae]AYG01578.1 flippase [Lactococcus allomyrinae]